MLLLDHIVFLVKDLEKASAHFQKAGYIVSKGGKHDNDMTENALIHFENSTFLELLALQKTWKIRIIKWFLATFPFRINLLAPIRDVKARFIVRALYGEEGVIDFCLLAKNELLDYEEIKHGNLPLTPMMEMKRVRPDGQVLKWNIFAPLEGELPFVMTPYRPSFQPKLENLAHPNHAKGFEKIKVYVTNFEDIVRKYELLLGILPVEKTEDSVLFRLERGEIEVFHAHKHIGSGIGFLEVEPSIF